MFKITCLEHFKSFDELLPWSWGKRYALRFLNYSFGKVHRKNVFKNICLYFWITFSCNMLCCVFSNTDSAFHLYFSVGGLLLSTENGLPQFLLRNSWEVPFQDSSSVTPKVEYSFLPPNMHDPPHLTKLCTFCHPNLVYFLVWCI